MSDTDGAPVADDTLVVDMKEAPADNAGGSSSATPFVMPAVVAAVLAKAVSPVVGLVGLGVGVLVLLVLRKPDEGRFVLRVDAGELVVARERAKEPVARFALTDLLDVALDKERRAAGRGGAMTERVRLVFERTPPADPIFVPEEHTTPLEASEWLSKVRVFLRRQGWIPADERTES